MLDYVHDHGRTKPARQKLFNPVNFEPVQNFEPLGRALAAEGDWCLRKLPIFTKGKKWCLPLMRRETPSHALWDGVGECKDSSTLLLVRLAAVKGDKTFVLDHKGVLETPRKHQASGSWLCPSSPSPAHTTDPGMSSGL